MSRVKQNSFDDKDNFDKNNYFDDTFEINHDEHFDEEFEVTYEEEFPFSYHFDTQPITHISDETIAMDTSEFNYENDSDYDYKEDSDYDYMEDSGDDTIEDSDYALSQRRAKAQKRNSKKYKYGTKSIYRAARLITRIVSLTITAGTFGFLAYNFWHGAAPYGDPMTLLTNPLAKPDYTLLGYTAVAALILMFELIAFFWSMTRARLKDGRHVYKEDTGRGLFSFIFIYAASLLSFLLCTLLPETMPYAVLNGIRGALDLFGSLHNSLFGPCLAGVIFCVVRRNMI